MTLRARERESFAAALGCVLAMMAAGCDGTAPAAPPLGMDGARRPLGSDAQVLLCHCPPGGTGGAEGCFTIAVAPAAVTAHLAHGDALGPCPDEGGGGTGAAGGAGAAGDPGGAGGADGEHHSPPSCLREACKPGQTCCVLKHKAYDIFQCVDTQRSRLHCGRCNNRCLPTEKCIDGTCGPATPAHPPVPKLCLPPCPPTQLCIDDQCVNAAPPTPPPNLCIPHCAPGESCCDGTCAHLDSDPNNCGACGTTCGTFQKCIGGSCVLCATLWSTIFDGSDDYVTMGTPFNLQGSEKLTLCAWYKTAAPGAAHLIGRQNPGTSGSSGARGYYLELDDAGRVCLTLAANIFASPKSIAVQICTNTAPPLGQWHHACGTYEGAVGDTPNEPFIHLYVDGGEQTKTTLSDNLKSAIVSSGADFTLGAAVATVGQSQAKHFQGLMDDAAIWLVALSPSQVQQVYGAGCPKVLSSLPGVPPPSGWWTMGDGDTPSVIFDHGGANDGVPTNMGPAPFSGDTPP